MSGIPESGDVELALNTEDVDSAFEDEEEEAPQTEQKTQTAEEENRQQPDPLIPETNETTDTTPIADPEEPTTPLKDAPSELQSIQPQMSAQQTTEWSRSKSFSIEFDLYQDAEELADGPNSPLPQPTTATNEPQPEEEEHKQLIEEDRRERKEEKIDKESIIKNVSICLGFLLHEESPLWSKDKRHHSTKELLEEMRRKKYKDELKNTAYTFWDRCSIFKSHYELGVEREDEDMSRQPSISEGRHNVKENEETFNNIMKHLDKREREEKWQILIKYWDSWKENRHVKMEEFLDLQRFNWDADYKEDIDAVMKDINGLVDKLHSLTEQKIEANARDKERMDRLKAINSRAEMKKWLHEYKKLAADIEEQEEITYLHTLADASSKLFKQIMGYSLDDDEDLKTSVSMANLPIMHWKWEHVVFWVEKIDEFKDFGSVFFEWKINGEELLAMSVQHIRWLTSCCYRAERVNKELVKDLIIEIRKQMISTMVTYQYGVYYKTIRQTKEKFEAEEEEQVRQSMDSKEYEISRDIGNLLDYLRPKKEQGPKALWKLEAFYFSKIDNMLAILVAPERCRKLFREWNPKFIFDDEETHHNILEEQEQERKRVAHEAERARSKSQSPLLAPTPSPAISPGTGGIASIANISTSMTDETAVQQLKPGSDGTATATAESKSEEEEEKVSTATRYVDCIDRLADCCCCKDNGCGTFIRNFDRVYLKVMVLYFIALSFGCLVVWFWMSSRSRMEVDISMRWTSESILARATQYMEWEFFKPQMILNIAVGGLYSGDISIDSTQYIGNPQYDAFFAQYKAYKATESSLFNLCMYEAENDTMICAEGEPLYIWEFDGTCSRGWLYDAETMERDISEQVEEECGQYVPKSRPWYATAQDLANVDIGWTEPYIFQSGGIGISLVRRLEYNGVEVIWLAEFTTVELDAIFKTVGSVTGGISYLSTERGSVIASSIGEYDLNPELSDCAETSETKCSADNPLLVDSIAILRDGADADHVLNVYSNDSWIEDDDMVMTITSFETTYLSGTNFEYGTIAVVYGDEHLSRIRTAEMVTMALFIVALVLALSISCFMAAYLQSLQKEIKHKHDPTGMQIRAQPSVDLDVIQEQMSQTFDRTETIPERIRLDQAREKDRDYIASKYDSYLVDSDCIMDHRTITICTFWYMMVVFLCTFYIWQRSVDATLDEITETFLTEEYMIVEDKVTNVVIVAESIADIVVERFNRGDMAVKGTDTIPKELDVIFANIMNSFKQPNGNFYAHMLYIGIPDGKFIGARRETADANKEKYDNTLRITVRDGATGWEYTHFPADPDTLERINTTEKLYANDLYDPRCRGWFKSTVSYMVDSDLWTTFGSAHNFLDFYNEDTLDARFSQNCIDSLAYFMDIWNVSAAQLANITANNDTIPEPDVSLQPNKFFAEKIAAKNIRYETVWSQYLFASGSLGLTASKPILDRTTGELLAVMAIDFTLEGLSDYLNSTNNDDINEDPWNAWIFTGDELHEMIASSDHNITRPAAQIEGCIQLAGASEDLVQWQAFEHPNWVIRVVSQEIIQFYPEMHMLPINTTTHPEQIKLPVDLPDALSGRFLTYPYSNESAEVSLNWIVSKSIDITNFETKENDDIKIIGFILLVLLFAVHMIQGNMQISTVKSDGMNEKRSEKEDVVAQHVSSANLSRKGSMQGTEAQKESQSRAQETYSKLLYEMVNIVEGSSAEIWEVFLHSFEERIGDYPISTSIVRDFMAKESNKHIKTDENDDLTLALCALQVEDEWMAFIALKSIKSKGWNTFITTVIFFHLLCGLYLPKTQVAFKKEKFSDGSSFAAMILIILFVICEIIDIVLQLIARYIHFGVIKRKYQICLMKLKHGFHHAYVAQVEMNRSVLWMMFFGGKNWKLFLTHIFFVGLIVTNTILMASIQFAPFEYYLPIVPIFLLGRSEDIRNFSYQFFYAVYLAKDVLFSYFILILIVAILALSVFRTILNPLSSTDTYSSSIRALITSFVFVSTGENYNEIVYSAIDRAEEGENPGGSQFWFNVVKESKTISIINLLFFVVVSIIGLYFFIPVMIHKFELAFKHSQQRISDRTLKTKINNIIAAFIMLDMNDDGEIDVAEFQHLVHSSIISRDVLFDAFANASGDEDQKISLFEFTSTLTNRTQFSVAINGIKCEVYRVQAWLECNWYRRRKIRYYLLIYLMVPAVCAALLRGLGGIDLGFLNVLAHVFFIANFLDINVRCFAFGRKRYFNLVRYENPPLIQQAIYNWRVERAIANIDDMDHGDFGHVTIRLSYDSKKWCNHNLRAIKPFSAWQKMTISTVHRFEMYLIWLATLGLIATFIRPASLSGYYYLFLQFYLFRLFTLIEANQRLVVLIFTIIPKFLNLLAFLFIFIFIWARIGCTIFAGKTDFVLEDIYPTAANATFNTLGSSILTLMQLMVGEGWHEVMYLNMLATRIEYSLYFILYIAIVTLIITNIFVGLFLSEIEGLDNKQSESDLVNQWMESHYNFKQIAHKRRNQLMKKLQDVQFMERDLQKQIEKIDQLVTHKTKKKKSKWKIFVDDSDDSANENNDNNNDNND